MPKSVKARTRTRIKVGATLEEADPAYEPLPQI